MKKKTNVDLDYNKQIKQFSHDYKQLPVKRKRLKSLQHKYELLLQKKQDELITEDIEALYQMKTELELLRKEITNLEQKTDITDFYLKNSELLINYYENDRNKIPHSPTNHNSPSRSSTPSILHFFGKKNTTATTTPTNTMHGRADMYEQYLSQNDPHYVGNIEYDRSEDYCNRCGVHRDLLPSEAVLVCPNCGEQIQTIMEADKPSYHDPPHENMYFAYKRINHFKEQLAHYQAKETTKIPQEIYDVILVECKKEKRTDLATLTKKRVKKYLQKYIHMGYNKYYENINQIICHLNSIQPISFTPDVEEKFCNMFMKIQEPFERHCPPDRTNFLSYTYVIYKFCQLAGYNEYLPYFNLLKSKDKLRQQDKIWKKICLDLGWTFHPST